MALVPVLTHHATNGTVVLSLDINNSGVAVGVHLDSSIPEANIELTRRNGGAVVVRSIPQGVTTVSIPPGKRFSYADEVSADWRVSVTA